MDVETFQYLEALWGRDLPDVPWPFDLSADPQAIVTALNTHLSARHRRPVLRVTVGEPLVVEPRPGTSPPDPVRKQP